MVEKMKMGDIRPIKSIPLRDQREITLMALLIWGEARGESEAGKYAVAQTVMNRWKKQSWFGRTVKDVILKPWQYSCFNSGDANREKLMNVSDDATWKKCAAIAQEVYHENVSRMVEIKGATHYCRTDCNPRWKKEMQFVCRIGNHDFYREELG